MSNHILVLSDQNGDLIGHMPFRQKIIIGSLADRYHMEFLIKVTVLQKSHTNIIESLLTT